jgi:hypothetical protein
MWSRRSDSRLVWWSNCAIMSLPGGNRSGRAALVQIVARYRDERRQAKGYFTSRGWEIVPDYVEPCASATDRRLEFQRMIDAATSLRLILVHRLQPPLPQTNSRSSSTFAASPRPTSVCCEMQPLRVRPRN